MRSDHENGEAGLIRILTTGGTIASRMDDASGAVVSSIEGAQLLAASAGLVPIDVRIEVERFCNLGSFAIDLETSFALSRRIDSVLGDDAVSGVVVTHGTDTMEESAFLADLVVSSGKPVVFTGAQRSADAPDGDGPRNLADAIRVAASREAWGLGPVIVFDGEIHAARDATKTHTSRLSTFASAEHGKLGDIDGDTVRISRRPPPRETFDVASIESRVDLVKLVIGADGRFVRCAVQTGAKAIVLEAFGRGNATPELTASVSEAVRAGVPVVVTSRCPQGRVLPIYGGGGGADLAASGAIFGGDLTGVKMRVLLCVLLASGFDQVALAAAIPRLAA
jgi:L-asparaginase